MISALGSETHMVQISCAMQSKCLCSWAGVRNEEKKGREKGARSTYVLD